MVVVLHVNGMDARKFTMVYYDETIYIEHHIRTFVCKPIPSHRNISSSSNSNECWLFGECMNPYAWEQKPFGVARNKSSERNRFTKVLLWSWSSCFIFWECNDMYSILFFYLSNYQYKDGILFCIFTCECYNYCIRFFRKLIADVVYIYIVLCVWSRILNNKLLSFDDPFVAAAATVANIPFPSTPPHPFSSPDFI